MKQKFGYMLFLMLWSMFVFSQETLSEKKVAFNNCKNGIFKVSKSIAISEYYLENDKIEDSQKWLDVSKKMLLNYPNDTLQYYSNSLQSELFYYMGLHQFGLHEAEKSIELSKKINDSLYISNAYLLKGINLYEMEKLSKAEDFFQKAKKYFPLKIKSNYKRYLINKEYIYNDIAQLKIKTNQLDSCYFYNKKAYKFAKNFKDYRCIANVERTFGELFIKQNRKDSAQFYFKKSIETSLNASIYDTALLGYGNLAECFSDDTQKMKYYFEKGQNLITNHNINPTFKRLFYDQSLMVFKKMNNINLQLALQEKLLSIDNDINKNGNFYIQNITNQYINSENKLLLSKINELDKQKNIKILQLVAALFMALILSLAIIIIRRKNKLQKLLLDQKNEISKDLHDDIGSELSSILINTNLLKNYVTNDKQTLLIDKISYTSSEISQRLNTFIWSLNTDNNNVQNFCDYVKQYAFKFLDGTEIKLFFSEDIEAISNKILNGNSRKNLFFCIKEILNNIVKHSAANQVQINVSSTDKKELLITIHDNGIGIQKANNFGNGLTNLKKRITNLNGILKIENSNGLKIRIKAPF